MINLIIVGIGDLATKIIPATKKLVVKNHVNKVIFVDTKSLVEVSKTLRLPPDLYEWFKVQKSHIILQDDGNTSLLDKIRDHLGDDDKIKTVVYLATPPNSYQYCISKYYTISHIFFLEKPWADHPSGFEQILKLADKKKVFGVDHYLWKQSVKRFLRDQRKITKLESESRNFDFVITEELPSKSRKYYWQYGEIADMMPHVLPLLDKLFNFEFSIDRNKLKLRCAIWNPNDFEYNNENIIRNETFTEMELSLGRQTIHIILGKGIKFHFNELSGITKFFSSDSELLINFEEIHDQIVTNDTAYDEMFSYISENIDKIENGQSEGLLDPERMKKYVNNISDLQEMIDDTYNVNEKRPRWIALQENPDLVYRKDKPIKLQYHKANNCVISGN